MPITDIVAEVTKSSYGDDDKIADIISFCEAPWGLNMNKITGSTTLRPVQQMVLKCYYNLELDNKQKSIIVRDHLNEVEKYQFTELEYLHYLWNEGRANIKEVTSQIRNELVLVAGRRGGKSKLGAIVCAYEAYRLVKKKHPQRYYGLTDASEIYMTTVATSTDQAELLFNDVAAYISESKFFDKYKNDPTVQSMKLRSPWDLEKGGSDGRTSIIIKAAPCSGRGLRGPANIVIVMDEQAHFIDSSSNKSDAAIYDAVTPSTLSFGRDAKILNISSPLNKAGKLYELYKHSFESEKLLMFQIPTWELYPTIDSSELRERFRRNPDVFWCEIGAQFSETVKSWMPHDPFLKCIIPELAEKMRGNPRTPYFMGVDVGLKKDPTAITVLHIENTVESVLDMHGNVIDEISVPKYELDKQVTLMAGEGDQQGQEFLDFDLIADTIEEICKEFSVHKGLFDQYNGVPLKQALEKKGLNQFEMKYFDRRINSEIYNNFLLQVIDGKLRLYDTKPRAEDLKHGEFITEVLELESRYISKYITEVEAPQQEGKHDDRSDSFVRALWCATEFLTDKGDQGNTSLLQSQHYQPSDYNSFMNRRRQSHRYVPDRQARKHNSPFNVFFNKRGGR